MTIATRDDLLSEIDSYTDRSYSESRKNTFVANAEAKLNRALSGSYRRRMNTTLTTDSTGLTTLPSGFVGMASIVRNVTGSIPLIATSWAALIAMNPYANAEDPTHYAIKGTSLRVTPVVADDFLVVFDSTLTALTSSNATNWLLTLAPDIYLTMCLAEEATFTREFSAAQGFAAAAYDQLNDLVGMDQVAAYGIAEIFLDVVTP